MRYQFIVMGLIATWLTFGTSSADGADDNKMNKASSSDAATPLAALDSPRGDQGAITVYPGLNGYAGALTIFNGDLIVGGGFSFAGAVLSVNIARWDGQNWHPLGGGLAGSSGSPPVMALTEYNGDLIAGGDFSSAGGVPANHIARWDGTNWYPLGDGTDDAIAALTVYDGKLIAGGYFEYAGGTWVKHIASWDGVSWSAIGPGMPPTWGTNDNVEALAVYNGRLILGGWFTAAGLVSADRIASWDGTSWGVLGSGVNWGVYALCVYDSELIVGGAFSSAGGVPTSYVGRWNGVNWNTMSSGMSSVVLSLASSDAVLVAGGEFALASGSVANSIAHWNGASWQPCGEGINPSTSVGEVSSVCIYEGDIIAGGSFSTAGEIEATGVAGWDGSDWYALMGPCCQNRGNVNGIDEINVSDLTYLVDFLFKSGPQPPCPEEGDVDASGTINVADLTYLVNYLFKGGPLPIDCP